MIKYTVVTSKDNFKAYLDWTGLTVEKIKARFCHQQEWIIKDKFGNAWKLIFTGNVNEYRIENLHNDPYFEVNMMVYGDKLEIHHAYEHGKNYRADSRLRKYKELGCMVSNCLRFNMLK